MAEWKFPVICRTRSKVKPTLDYMCVEEPVELLDANNGTLLVDGSALIEHKLKSRPIYTQITPREPVLSWVSFVDDKILAIVIQYGKTAQIDWYASTLGGWW